MLDILDSADSEQVVVDAVTDALEENRVDIALEVVRAARDTLRQETYDYLTAEIREVLIRDSV